MRPVGKASFDTTKRTCRGACGVGLCEGCVAALGRGMNGSWRELPGITPQRGPLDANFFFEDSHQFVGRPVIAARADQCRPKGGGGGREIARLSIIVMAFGSGRTGLAFGVGVFLANSLPGNYREPNQLEQPPERVPRPKGRRQEELGHWRYRLAFKPHQGTLLECKG